MDHNEVLLIGVGDPEGKEEAFCYTVDAPTNLWVGAICDDGSRMSIPFMAYMLNGLIEDDCWDEGSSFSEQNQDGVTLTAVVGPEVPARSVQAFQSLSDTVRRVCVKVAR